MTFQKRIRIGIRTLLPHQFYLCKVQNCIYYQAFLKFTNSLWGKYVNQLRLPHKERLLICGFHFRPYTLKRDNAIKSILPIKPYESLIFYPISAQFQNQTIQILSTIIKNYLANLNFARLGAKMPFFWKIQNFIKSENFDGFFLNLIPNVLEHQSLYKE